MNGHTSEFRAAGLASYNGHSIAQSLRMGRSNGTGRPISGHISGVIASRETWPGREYGIRQPSECETPLSPSEIAVFLAIGGNQ